MIRVIGTPPTADNRKEKHSLCQVPVAVSQHIDRNERVVTFDFAKSSPIHDAIPSDQDTVLFLSLILVSYLCTTDRRVELSKIFLKDHVCNIWSKVSHK